MRTLASILFIFFGAMPGGSAVDKARYDIVLYGGSVVDGTGASPYRADVAIAGGRIAKIGPLGEYAATRKIDVSGRVVAPGFIDLLRHNDLLWSLKEQQRAIREGVTSGLVGNCGFSVLDVDKNLTKIQKQRCLINLGTLIGQGSVRDWFVRSKRKELASSENMAKMKAFVEKALRDGAFGLSSGLGYEPGEWCDPEEIQELASVLSKFPNAAYYTHIRNYRSSVLEAIQEAVDVAKRTKVPVVIQHLLFKLPSNWDQTESGLLLLERAREKGLNVYATVYPYDFWGSEVQIPLFQFLYLKPEAIRWTYHRNDSRTEAVLADIRRRLQEYGGGDKVELTRVGSKAFKSFLGLTLKDLARQRKMTEEAVVLALLLENGREVKICYHGLSEEGLIKKIQDPSILFGSDSTGSIPHPRDVGAFPRLLGTYVRDKRVIRLSEAVHRLTGEPAKILGLKDRGLVRVGNWGDIVVFDEKAMGDKASAVSPWETPSGVKMVLVNGQLVYDNGAFSGRGPGHVLRRSDL